MNFTTLKNDSGRSTAVACAQCVEDQPESDGVVVLEPGTKEYKSVFNKPRLMDKFDSLPYGHY